MTNKDQTTTLEGVGSTGGLEAATWADCLRIAENAATKEELVLIVDKIDEAFFKDKNFLVVPPYGWAMLTKIVGEKCTIFNASNFEGNSAAESRPTEPKAE